MRHIEEGEELEKERIPYDSNESFRKRVTPKSSSAYGTAHPNLGEVGRMGIYVIGGTSPIHIPHRIPPRNKCNGSHHSCRVGSSAADYS